MTGHEPGADRLLAAGRDADVFAVDAHRVVRRYRSGGDVVAEAAVMRHVSGQGFPAPRVHAAAGTDLVLERLYGPTLLAALTAGGIAPSAAAEVLADLHTRLHALSPADACNPGDRILHLDLHPDNVVLTDRGPVLIDWSNATEGPPDLDVALTALILAEAAVGSYLPPELAPAARELLAGFVTGAGGDPLGQLDAAVARRAADPNLTAEESGRLGRAAERVRASVTGPAGRRGRRASR